MGLIETANSLFYFKIGSHRKKSPRACCDSTNANFSTIRDVAVVVSHKNVRFST